MEEKKPLQSIYNEFKDFITGFESVILGTISKDSKPESSYAPVLQHNNRFYIYVSELSSHTQNLIDVPKASLLFIEPEQEAKHLFARKRATINTDVNHIERETNEWQ